MVFYFMLDNPGGCDLFNNGILDVLKDMLSWLESRHRSILCKYILFARWNKVGKISYLAGLYDKNVRNSTGIKADIQDWDCIVIY
jgi:hypothetical protein